MTIMSLDADLVDEIEPWFDDDEIRRFLGGRDWMRRELRLIHEMPGRTEGGSTVVGRWGWVVFESGAPVAFVGMERRDDETASGCLLVAPQSRRQGVGRRALMTIAGQAELEGVTCFVGGVEPENHASRCCLASVGAVIADVPDDEGMLAVSAVLSPGDVAE
jgi:GNAT superfamily N-acetyltransferase